MSAADWDLMERAQVNFAKPTRDVVATDGQKLTLGDTTITMYRDARPHARHDLVDLPGEGRRHHPHGGLLGRHGLQLGARTRRYITPERPARFWFESYAQSAQRFRDAGSRAGADVVLSNHTKYDLSTTKLALVQKRARGSAHPYVIGKENVQRFFTIAAECAAGRRRDDELEQFLVPCSRQSSVLRPLFSVRTRSVVPCARA